MGLYNSLKRMSKIGLAGILGYGVGVVNDEVGEIIPEIVPMGTNISLFDGLKAIAAIVIIAVIAAAVFPMLMQAARI